MTISLSDPGPEGAAAEQLHWLCPIEDRRAEGAEREGMLKDVGIGSYLQVVEWSSRLYRGGPARVSPRVAAVLKRLGTTPERWLALLRAVARRRIFLPRVPAPPDQTEAGTAEQAGSH